MDTFWQDVKYGLRKLAKNPGFTAVSLIVLALGIGANTAIFSVVNAVLLKPLAYAEPERLVILWEQAQKMETSVAYPNFVDMRDRQTSFDRFAAFRRESFNMTGAGEPERLQGRMVSSDFFSAFGVPLSSGRDFTPEDDRPGANPVVILSYDFWQRRFGGDESVVGRQLTLNDRSFTVAGIAGKSFKFGSGADLFAPLGLFADRYPTRGMHPGLYVVGKLKPGVSLEKGRADLDGIFAALNEQFPDEIGGRRSHVESLYENTVSEVRSSLWILLGAVTFVLLIACANVANLQLARAATRHREIALRAALGAGRMRIIRQLLTENVVLSIAGGVIGLLLAVWGTSALITALPDGIPRLEDVRVDGRVLAFTFAVSVLTGVVFGLVPAFAVSKPDVNDALKEGERGSTGGRHRVRSTLVVSEIALALVLLVGAGLMIRSIWGLQRVQLGFDSSNLLTVNLSMTVDKEQVDKAKAFVNEIEQRLKAIPGAEAAAVTGGLPFVGAPEDSFYISKESMNEPDAEKMAVAYAVTPGYKDALGIKVLSGRFLTDADRTDTAPVAVVDESFVEKYYGGENPVGKYLYNDPGDPAMQIVGVVGHVKHYGIDGEVPVDPQVYLPISQMPAMAMPFVARNLGLLVRTHQDPLSLTTAVRDQVRALDANQPIFRFRTMDEIVASSLAARRFSMFLFAVFAGVALLLAAVGIYGVMAYSIEQRTHEVGIRMALGARGRDVLWMVLRQGMVLAGIGLVAGVAAALALTRVMASLLFSVSATDPATFTTVAVILAAVALAACVIPARRATRVDPMRALRHE